MSIKTTIESLKVLCLGDVVGRPGRSTLKQILKGFCKENEIDFTVVNGENASGGLGLSPETAQEFKSFGLNVVTLGDHTWQSRKITTYLDDNSDFCIRPANYPEGAPGRGWTVVQGQSGFKIGVFNLLGRVFSNIPLDCPFRKADELLAGPLADCQAIVCDIHAEATSEKIALGRYLDGRVSLVFGTHTHVQTADECILPAGTGFITDLGMCGSIDSVIGMDTGVALERFLTGMPVDYRVGPNPGVISGIMADLSLTKLATLSISRVREVVRSG